jgi:glutamate dehydrogenase
MNARPASVSALFPVTAPRLATEPTEEDPPAGTSDDDPLPNLERLVAEAMSLAATSGGSGPDLADLINRFWRLVPDEDLGARASAEMLTAVQDHLDLATQRLPGEMKLHIDNAGDRTAVLIVTDDMPFLVDSVTAAINSLGLDLALLAHPQVVVRRAALGRLLETSNPTTPAGASCWRAGCASSSAGCATRVC